MATVTGINGFLLHNLVLRWRRMPVPCGQSLRQEAGMEARPAAEASDERRYRGPPVPGTPQPSPAGDGPK